MSIRKPGWPTSWPGSPSIRPTGSTHSCRGIGGRVRRRKVRRRDRGGIAAIFTIGYIASMLSEDEDWLYELSIDMFPEDGCLRVYGVGEDSVTAFTEDGIECLQQIIADERAAGRAPPLVKPT